MTDLNEEAHLKTPVEHHQETDTTMAMVVYGLYLASFVVGFTAVVGLIIAYVYKGNGPQWLDEHYRYQIRTFWIGMLYGFISLLLVIFVVMLMVFSVGLPFFMVGLPIMLALAVWTIVRIIKGFKGLQEQNAPANVDSWFV